jgi:hypothetical protein
MDTKEPKPHRGWEKMREMARASAETKKLRLKKEEAYRYMVGSIRELQRKRIVLGLTKRGYPRP